MKKAHKKTYISKKIHGKQENKQVILGQRKFTKAKNNDSEDAFVEDKKQQYAIENSSLFDRNHLKWTI